MAAAPRGHHMQDSPVPGCIRFGPFQLDSRSGELRNGDTRQHLADQPLAILKALIERPGELVGRDELRERLWPDGTFVGFDHGLNSAINRLREALHDSAESPRFIETIPRRGYRLLVPIEVIGSSGRSATQDAPFASASAASGEVSIEVDRAVDAGGRLHKPVEHGRPSKVLSWIASAAIGVLWLVWLLWQPREGPHAPLIANVAIELPAGWQTNKNLSPAISPDSQYIAISASHRSGGSGVWLRPLAGHAWRMLNHTRDGAFAVLVAGQRRDRLFRRRQTEDSELGGGIRYESSATPRLVQAVEYPRVPSSSAPETPAASWQSTSRPLKSEA